MELQLVSDNQIEQDGINQEWLEEWIAYRKEDLKKPCTPRAVSMLKKKLIQWSPAEQERLICHAIEMNWQGIYWVEPPKQVTTRTRSIEQDLMDTSWAN